MESLTLYIVEFTAVNWSLGGFVCDFWLYVSEEGVSVLAFCFSSDGFELSSSSMLSTQDEKSMEVGFGRSRQSLEGWVRMAALRSVRAPLRGFSYKKQKDYSSVVEKLEIVAPSAEDEESREFGCETPKSVDHMIPAVEIDLCPPAPKKPRGVGRLALACSVASEDHGTCQELRLAPCYLF